MRKCANQLVQVAQKSDFADLFVENATNFIAFSVDLQNVLKKVVLWVINSITKNGTKLDTSVIFVVFLLQ